MLGSQFFQREIEKHLAVEVKEQLARRAAAYPLQLRCLVL